MSHVDVPKARTPIVIALLCALAGCGRTVASLTYETVGTTKEAPLVLAEGARVTLSSHAAKYSYNGTNAVMLDAELLKAGAVVAKVTCEGFGLEDGSGSGCRSSQHNFTCALKAPPGGSDTFRVATRMKRPTLATFEGFEVRARQ